jgi:anti-sigma factor RsiW
MNCGQFRQFYSDFTDGLLDEAEEVAFHVHMAECVACRKFDLVLQQGCVALRRLQSPQPSGDFEARLYDRIVKECAELAEPALRQWSGLAGAALIMAVAAAGVARWHAHAASLPVAPTARHAGMANPGATDPFVPRFAGDTSIRYLGRIPVLPVSRDTLRSASRPAKSFEITVDWMVP